MVIVFVFHGIRNGKVDKRADWKAGMNTFYISISGPVTNIRSFGRCVIKHNWRTSSGNGRIEPLGLSQIEIALYTGLGTIYVPMNSSIQYIVDPKKRAHLRGKNPGRTEK